MADMRTGMAALIMAFIVIVVGVALIGSIADSTVDVTEVKTVTNESTALVNNTAVRLDNRQLVAVTRVGNTTVALTPTTDYTVNLAAGTVTLVAGTAVNFTPATMDVSYTHRQVGNSTARTLVNLVVLLFAIGLFGFILAALSPQFRELIGMG